MDAEEKAHRKQELSIMPKGELQQRILNMRSNSRELEKAKAISEEFLEFAETVFKDRFKENPL